MVNTIPICHHACRMISVRPLCGDPRSGPGRSPHLHCAGRPRPDPDTGEDREEDEAPCDGIEGPFRGLELPVFSKRPPSGWKSYPDPGLCVRNGIGRNEHDLTSREDCDRDRPRISGAGIPCLDAGPGPVPGGERSVRHPVRGDQDPAGRRELHHCIGFPRRRENEIASRWSRQGQGLSRALRHSRRRGTRNHDPGREKNGNDGDDPAGAPSGPSGNRHGSSGGDRGRSSKGIGTDRTRSPALRTGALPDPAEQPL